MPASSRVDVPLWPPSADSVVRALATAAVGGRSVLGGEEPEGFTFPAARGVFDRRAPEPVDRGALAESRHVRLALAPSSFDPALGQVQLDPVQLDPVQLDEFQLDAGLDRLEASLGTSPHEEILLSGGVGPVVHLACLGLSLRRGGAWLFDPSPAASAYAAGGVLWARPTLAILTPAEVVALRDSWDRRAAAASRLRALVVAPPAEEAQPEAVRMSTPDALWPSPPVPLLSLDDAVGAGAADDAEGDAAVRHFLAVLRQDRW